MPTATLPRRYGSHLRLCLSSAAESSSSSHVAASLSALAGNDIAVSSAPSRPRTIACALPRGALALVPALRDLSQGREENRRGLRRLNAAPVFSRWTHLTVAQKRIDAGSKPAQATILRLAARMVESEKDILVESLFIASSPVIGTTARVLSTSGMLGCMLPACAFHRQIGQPIGWLEGSYMRPTRPSAHARADSGNGVNEASANEA